MANVYEIPLRPERQSFGVTLGTTDYRFRLTYCDAPEGGWLLDIGDVNGVPMVRGIALVTGLDLLEQYSHLGFPGRLFIVNSDGSDNPPTFTNLGIIAKLYFETLA